MALALALMLSASFASAAGLPDGRAYELVTPLEKDGISPEEPIPSPDGNAVDWLGIGGCCGASAGAAQLYQSRRGAGGWSTTGITPQSSKPLVGIFEEQAPLFWTPDLSETIYTTPASYDSRDDDDGELDLYRAGAEATPAWISQGPLGGTGREGVTFDEATSDANNVVFSTQEQLTADAVGLNPELSTPAQFLYVRNLPAGTTKLVNVDDNDTVTDPDGAILGNAGFLSQGFLPANGYGSTTNAISADGSKIFFESPPPEVNDVNGARPTHLYMRDESTGTTTSLDDPSATGSAQYEGASQDGSLVFFSSDEGLGGDTNTDPELYVFNTTARQLGVVPPMSVMPISGSGEVDGRLLGETALATDGSRVYFVARGVLAGNVTPQGQATAGQANFYLFDTATGQTTFVAPLGEGDVATEGKAGGLAGEPDTSRPAIPTPDGSVLLFDSATDLTHQNPAGPTTTLSTEISYGETSIEVGSTAGIVPHRVLTIDGGGYLEETVRVKAVTDATHLQLSTPTSYGHEAGVSVSEGAVAELYRYSATDGSLVCVSCMPAGKLPSGSASLGGSAGGSYGPQDQTVPMSADGSRIFFNTPDALVDEDNNEGQPSIGPFGATTASDVYEWENGHVHLISAGHTAGAILGGTTPSGNDVFFTTNVQLVPQDTDGFLDVYDARVGGGSPAAPVPSQCSGASCRPASAPVVFYSVPGSEAPSEAGNLISPVVINPAFTVGTITAAQRGLLAKTGTVTLKLSATSAGRLSARAFASLGGKVERVASTSLAMGAGAGKATLHLDHAARAALARKGRLALRIELSFAPSGTTSALVKRAELELTTPRHKRGGAR